MTFASIEFVIFFIIVFGIILLLQRIKISTLERKRIEYVVLLIASYIFYCWWDARFGFLLLGVTAISYLTALRKSKAAFITGVAAPLVVLCIFKYFNFFVGSFCALFGINNNGAINIILPVGISFYIFQALSYTLDVYNGKLEHEKSFVKYALYISFFPQLVAGPIVKASEFLPQLYEDRRITLKNVEQGIQIFVFGMFKKLVIADNLSVFVDEVYNAPTAFNTITVWMAAIAYSIQIYMDFSGYSDMAIGCAKCFGYDLTRNFNLPYISKNVSEFWKRWHISLSSWLQQYLYFPLGGNRKGTIRTYVNLLLTMVLGGLWHGADWTFVVWGALHGLALCIHKFTLRITGAHVKAKKRRRILQIVLDTIKVLATNLFVTLCWVVFRATNFENAMDVLNRLFVYHDGILHVYSWFIISVVLVIAATLIAYVISRRKLGADKFVFEGQYIVLNLSKIWALVVLFVAAGLILALAYVNSNPFIYFQF